MLETNKPLYTSRRKVARSLTGAQAKEIFDYARRVHVRIGKKLCPTYKEIAQTLGYDYQIVLRICTGKSYCNVTGYRNKNRSKSDPTPKPMRKLLTDEQAKEIFDYCRLVRVQVGEQKCPTYKEIAVTLGYGYTSVLGVVSGQFYSHITGQQWKPREKHA